MRSSKRLTARILSAVLAIMMLFSVMAVGFTASAANTEIAQTGATPDIIYLNAGVWDQAGAEFRAWVWGGTTADKWIYFTDEDGDGIYQAALGNGYTGMKVLRAAPNTTEWTSWNDSGDQTIPTDGKNMLVVKDWSSFSWSTFTPVTHNPGDASTINLMGTLTDWATGKNMVYATDTTKVTTSVELKAGSYEFKVKNGDTWLGYKGTVTDTTTGITFSGSVNDNAALTATADGTYTFTYTTATKSMAITYTAPATTETTAAAGGDTTETTATAGTDTPGETNGTALTIDWVESNGLYAYASAPASPDEVGTEAWQRWHSVSGKDYRYFFLAPSADAETVVIYNSYSKAVEINGVTIDAGCFAYVPYENGETYTTTAEYSVKIIKTDAEGTVYINNGATEYKDENKNVISNTDLYSFLTGGTKNREAKGTGAVASESDGVQDAPVKKIKGRGNSTWNLAKKPFNITHEEKVEIDGMKGKKWSLLANAQDPSLLRNRLVYDLANEIGMKYACDSRFVDFVVNGRYKGSYQLTQKIEMGKNTVMPDLEEPEVEDVVDEETGETIPYPKDNFDFILELDTEKNAQSSGDLGFKTNRGQWMTYKTPDEPATEQEAFMQAKYQAVENALYSDDLATLETLVSMDDLAKAYLVNEVAKNLDSGVTSCYFVYNSAEGIFYLSPVWDYDNALGNSVGTVADREDIDGNSLDLARPDGWYAKELAHYDSNFTGKRSVFSQACYTTSKTADGKTFMDIVKEVWASNFAGVADVLAGAAEAKNGRLNSTAGYMENLADSGNWNYSYAGWELTADNGWVSNHGSLTMYTYDSAANELTSATKTYDQYTLDGQANYAADWMISRLNWMDAQFNSAEVVAPADITVYFTNNWLWTDVRVHFWGSAFEADTTWPGKVMTFHETNDGGEDIYKAVIPGDAAGIVFTGQKDDGSGLDQSPDIVPEDKLGYYMVWDSANSCNSYGTYDSYQKAEETTTASATAAATTAAATTAADTTAAATTAAPAGTKTVYFSNGSYWGEPINAYYFYEGEDGDPAWPGAEMTYVETNDFGQDVYSIEVPADIDFIIFNGEGGQTVDIPGADIPDGWGAYVTDADPYYGTYQYETAEETTAAATTAAATTAAATTVATTTAAATTATETEGTVIYLKVNNDWPAASAYYAVWNWGDDVDGNWVTMTATETEGIYTATLPAGATELLFGRMNPDFATPAWNTDTEKHVWNQTNDQTLPTDGKNMFVLDAGWSGIDGTWMEYDVNVTTPTLPHVGEDTTVYFSNGAGWDTVKVYTWGGDNASASWPGTAMEFVETNSYGQDVYKAVIPAGTEGLLFNGMVTGSEGNAYQTVDVDVADVAEGVGFYPTEQIKEDGNSDYDKWNYGTYDYESGEQGETVVTATPDEPKASTDEAAVIYFSNSKGWDTVNVHYWGAESTEWPGAAMELVGINGYGQEIYKITIPAGTEGIVFNAGKGEAQSVDFEDVDAIVDNAGFYPDEEVDGKWTLGTYTYTEGDATPDESTPDETTSTTTPAAVAAIAGNFTEWDKIEMVAGEGTTYTYTIYLAAGSYEFKIVENGEWLGNNGEFENTCVGWTFKSGDENGNCKFTATGGTYTFAFDTETNKVTVTAELDPIETTTPDVTEPTTPAEYVVNLVGDMNAWDANIKMATEDDNAYTATYELKAGTYKFKLIDNGTWLGNDGTIENVANGWTFKAEAGDCTLNATGGVYTFTFDKTTKKLTVTAVLDEVKYTATWDEADTYTVTGATEVVAGTDYTFTVEAAEGYEIDAVIVDMEILEAVDGVYTIADVKGNIEILVIATEKSAVIVPDETKYYTVVFVNDDGTLISSQTVKEGDAAVAPEAPAKAADAEFTYTFAAWDADFSVITADTVVKATYTAVKNTYTVTFVGKDGQTLATQTVEYGTAATAPEAPAVDGFTFKGWDVDFKNITADTTVTAKYSKVVVPATTGNLKIEVSAGKGFTIAFGDGAARTQGPSYYNSSAPIGANVTVTALPYADGAKFIGWVNTANGKVLSTDETYSFVTSGNDFIKAMYAADLDGIQMVIFYFDKGGQQWDVQYYSATDAIQFPAVNPESLGWEFKGWNMTEAEIQAAIAAGNDVTVLPVWEKALVYIDIIVNGGTVTAHGGQNAAGQYLADNGTTVTANAAPAGQKFAYWVDGDGNIKSYSTEYKFYPAQAIELTAVYVAEDATIEYKTLVTVDTFTPSAYGSFTVSWYVPAAENNLTFIGGGIIAVNKDFYDEATFVHGTTDTNVWDRTGSTTATSNTYVWTGPVASGQTWYAKGWVQYSTADGEIVTVYSDMFTATKD